MSSIMRLQVLIVELSCEKRGGMMPEEAEHSFWSDSGHRKDEALHVFVYFIFFFFFPTLKFRKKKKGRVGFYFNVDQSKELIFFYPLLIKRWCNCWQFIRVVSLFRCCSIELELTFKIGENLPFKWMHLKGNGLCVVGFVWNTAKKKDESKWKRLFAIASFVARPDWIGCDYGSQQKKGRSLSRISLCKRRGRWMVCNASQSSLERSSLRIHE